MEKQPIIKCPKCGEEIDCLINVQSGSETWRVELFNDELEFDDSEFYGDDNVNHFECPKCNQIIATNQEDAIKILKGKPITEK